MHALPKYTFYSNQHNILKNKSADIQAEIKQLSEDWCTRELTAGQRCMQWIQQNTAALDIRSTLFVTLEINLIAAFKKHLYEPSPSHDFAAFLNTSIIANEKTIQLQTKLIETIFDFAETTFRDCSSTVSQTNFLDRFSHLTFFLVVSALDSQSLFHHFAGPARSMVKSLQETMWLLFVKNLARHFFSSSREWYRKIPLYLPIPLNSPILLGCPLVLAIDINSKVSAVTTSCHALLACANLLVLTKNRDLILEVRENYLQWYDDYLNHNFGIIGNERLGMSKWVNKCKQNMLKTLKTALSTAESYLNSRATSKIYKKYQGLAQWLLKYAPACSPMSPAPLTVSIYIGEETKDHFRSLQTSVMAADVTTAKLDLSFRKRKKGQAIHRWFVSHRSRFIVVR